MPTVLLTVDGRDNSSGALARVNAALGETGSAANKTATALARYEQASVRAARAAAQVAEIAATAGGATDRYARAADSAATATIRQAEAGMRLAQAYRSQAEAADRAAAAEAKARSGGGGSSTGSHGGGGLGTAGRILLGGAVYQGGYMLASGVASSVGRSAEYSRVTGSTAAETGLSGPQTTTLSDAITALAASGKQPYDRTTLMQGAYSLASLGIGQRTTDFPGAVAAITNISAKMSGAAGATDTSAASDAIVSVLNDYGLNNQNVVGNAGRVSDQLQVATKLAKAELPQFAQAVAVPAQMAAQLGVSSGGLLGFMAAESAGGIANTDLSDPTYALLASSLRPTQVQSRVAKGLGIQYDSSFWGKNGLAGGATSIEAAMQSRKLTTDQQMTALTALFGNQAAAKGFMAAENAGGLQDVTKQVLGSKGAVNAAYSVSQLAAGAQLQNAETRLATAFDQVSTKALPGLVTALGVAADVLDNLGKGKPVTASGIGGPLGFIGHLGDEAAYRLGLANNPDAATTSTAAHAAAAVRGVHAAAAGVVSPSGWYGGLAPLGSGASAPSGTAYKGPTGAAFVANFAGPGRGGVTSDADMNRFEGNLKLAILQGQSPSTVQSALGLAVQAIQQNASLTGTRKSLDIVAQQQEAAKYLGASAKAASASPFHANNAGTGGFEAGFGATVARAGGGRDATESAVVKLQHALEVATGKNAQYLQEIRDLLARLGSVPTARQSPLAGTGTNRMIAR